MNAQAIHHPLNSRTQRLWLHGGGSKAGFKIDKFKIYDMARDYSAVGGDAIHQGNNDSAARP